MKSRRRENEALIRRYFEELFNQGQVELIPQLLADDYVNYSPGPGVPPGREGVAVVVGALRQAFPDIHYQVEDLVAGDAAVAARTTMTGTHRGDFFGTTPTGRAVRVSQMTIEKIRDGRIVAHHRVTDELSLMRQLGVVV